jgi:hypothetical protein
MRIEGQRVLVSMIELDLFGKPVPLFRIMLYDQI